MNKAKPRKSVVKRFKITKSGKILHRVHGSRHLKSTKSKNRVRNMRKLREIKGIFKKKLKKMIQR